MTGCVAERLTGAACCDMTCIGATLGGELGLGTEFWGSVIFCPDCFGSVGLGFGAAVCDITCIGATLGGELGTEFLRSVVFCPDCFASVGFGAACCDMTCIGATLGGELGLGTEVWAIAGFACASNTRPMLTAAATVASFVKFTVVSFSEESKKLVVSDRSRQPGCHHKGGPEKARPTHNRRMTDY